VVIFAHDGEFFHVVASVLELFHRTFGL
jgi:hypothetical protein